MEYISERWCHHSRAEECSKPHRAATFTGIEMGCWWKVASLNTGLQQGFARNSELLHECMSNFLDKPGRKLQFGKTFFQGIDVGAHLHRSLKYGALGQSCMPEIKHKRTVAWGKTVPLLGLHLGEASGPLQGRCLRAVILGIGFLLHFTTNSKAQISHPTTFLGQTSKWQKRATLPKRNNVGL